MLHLVKMGIPYVSASSCISFVCHLTLVVVVVVVGVKWSGRREKSEKQNKRLEMNLLKVACDGRTLWEKERVKDNRNKKYK